MKGCLNSIPGTVLILVGLLLVGFAAFFYTGSETFLPFYDYGIAIDAGSSHSEAALYRWSDDKKVQQIDSCSTNHGIDFYGAVTSKTVNELLPCVDKLVKEINSSSDPTPVVLAATAGMRMLEAKDVALTNKIFKDLDTALKSIKPKGTTLVIENPGVLPPQKEGLYAWITANYLLHLIPPEERNACSKVPKGSTVGVLDMGGASAQIAYATTAKKATEVAKLFDKEYDVMTYSNLCYGGDQARLRYLALVIKAHKESRENIPDPCTNKGFTRKVDGKSLMGGVCLYEPIGRSPQYVDGNATYSFVGTGNMEECDRIIQILTDPHQCSENFKMCPQISEESPPSETHFTSISNFYRATRVIPLLKKQSSCSYEEFKAGMSTFCSLPASQVTEELCETKVKYCQNFCILLPFIDHTLRDIYKFKTENWKKIEYVQDVAGVSLGWALGDMLVLSNSMPGVKPSRPFLDGYLPIWAAVIVALGGLLLIVIGGLSWTGRARFGYESV